MTEAEWLECGDAGKMLRLVWERATARRLRLFACAWCRMAHHHLLQDSPAWVAVETGELYADGLVGNEGCWAARESAAVAVEAAVTEQRWEEAAATADARRCAEPARVRIVRLGMYDGFWRPDLCSLLRDLFGNPFRPVSLASAWLTPTVESLATPAYNDRDLPSGHLDYDRLVILADALEEAGCDDAEILIHLRSPGPHVRGCWALDLILGKQ